MKYLLRIKKIYPSLNQKDKNLLKHLIQIDDSKYLQRALEYLNILDSGDELSAYRVRNSITTIKEDTKNRIEKYLYYKIIDSLPVLSIKDKVRGVNQIKEFSEQLIHRFCLSETEYVDYVSNRLKEEGINQMLTPIASDALYDSLFTKNNLISNYYDFVFVQNRIQQLNLEVSHLWKRFLNRLIAREYYLSDSVVQEVKMYVKELNELGFTAPTYYLTLIKIYINIQFEEKGLFALEEYLEKEAQSRGGINNLELKKLIMGYANFSKFNFQKSYEHIVNIDESALFDTNLVLYFDLKMNTLFELKRFNELIAFFKKFYSWVKRVKIDDFYAFHHYLFMRACFEIADYELNEEHLVDYRIRDVRLKLNYDYIVLCFMIKMDLDPFVIEKKREGLRSKFRRVKSNLNTTEVDLYQNIFSGKIEFSALINRQSAKKSVFGRKSLLNSIHRLTSDIKLQAICMR